MHRLAAIAVGLVSVAGFAGAASAGDLPVKVYTKAPVIAPIYNWGGFYLGLNAGAPPATIAGFCPNAGGCGPGRAERRLLGRDRRCGRRSDRLPLAGHQLGVRCRSPWRWAGLKGSNFDAFGTFGGLPFLNQTKTDAIGLFTGQVGYAWNNWLGYFKGGAAVTHNTYNGVVATAVGAFPVGTAFDGASESRWGGVAGVGVEYGFAPNWSVALEYDHLLMGRSSNNIITPAGVFDRTESIKQDVDMATIRLNYSFGGPLVAEIVSSRPANLRRAAKAR